MAGSSVSLISSTGGALLPSTLTGFSVNGAVALSINTTGAAVAAISVGSSTVQFDTDPTAGNQGEIAFNPATPDSYRIKANGLDGTILNQVLSTGM